VRQYVGVSEKARRLSNRKVERRKRSTYIRDLRL